MKTTIFYAVLLAGIVSTSSCEKGCHECHYEDANDKEVELGEKCDDELKELEANGITIGSTTYEVHCHDH